MEERSVQDNKACGKSSEGKKIIWQYFSRMHAKEKHWADNSSVLEPMGSESQAPKK